MRDWKNILSDEEPLSEEDLLNYLKHHPTDSTVQSASGKALDPFEKDALEGLQEIKNTEKVKSHVKQLKRHLDKQIKAKNANKKRFKTNDFQWIFFALILLLILCVISFVVIKMQ